jgi:hypothetical protein
MAHKVSDDMDGKLVLNDWSQVRQVFQRPIAFQPVFSKIGGGALAGLFLSQAFYWDERTKDPDGWFYKTQDEWERETTLTRREQETVRRKLIERGLIEEQKRGLPCKLYYRLNRQNIIIALSQNECTDATYKYGGIRQAGMAGSDTQDCTNAPNNY